jgi:osmotically-inducible protein OsmY
MGADRDVQEQILAALEWEPGIDAARIGVTVSNGVVMLEGTVTTLLQKATAERAARHVPGVRVVANELEVSLDHTTRRSDTALAEAVANALRWHSALTPEAVQATVDQGWVVLSGAVTWQFQKTAAERAVQELHGVKGVTNGIIVQPKACAGDVKAKIESAFKRSAEIDAQNVRVEVRGGVVILTGTVRSPGEREEAERAAWAAPGVTKVEDRLRVSSCDSAGALSS